MSVPPAWTTEDHARHAFHNGTSGARIIGISGTNARSTPTARRVLTLLEEQEDEMAAIDPTMSVARVVLEHSACTRVFLAHHIDFCCRGELSVSAACAGKGLDLEAVIAELERALGRRTTASEADMMPTRELVAYIVGRHHAYLRATLPTVESLADKVARVHGARDGKLVELSEVVREVREVLEPHLDEEENTLFPALLGGSVVRPLVEHELRAMRSDHLHVGEALTRLRVLADDYAAPDWACASYRTLMSELRAIQDDTFEHVHLENHVLLPRFLDPSRDDAISRDHAPSGAPVRCGPDRNTDRGPSAPAAAIGHPNGSGTRCARVGTA